MVLLETVYHSWMHEEVNAGFLKLVKSICREEVVYVGEKEHLKCVSRIYREGGVSYERISEFKKGNSWDSYKLAGYYFKMISGVIRKYHPSRLFLLCAYRPGILAAEMAAFMNQCCSIFVILHSMVEELKGGNAYRNLLRIAGHSQNIGFISYNPYCTAGYWGLPEDKIIFIHHPYIKSSKQVRRNIALDKTVIGIIGACANSKALKIIQIVNRKKIEKEYEFWIISRFGENFKGIPHVKILNLEFDREEKRKIMSHMNYLLLPYGKQEYTISASGVLWDGVSNEVPCLMLDSRYFGYYMPYKIGCQANDIRTLADLIEERIVQGNEDCQFFQGMEELQQDNRKVMERLLENGNSLSVRPGRGGK